MMEPEIKTRITNLIAKLAGSPDYDPRIKPKFPIEFYLGMAVDKILQIEGIDLDDYEKKPTVNVISDANPVIEPADNNIYKCGACETLTLDNIPETGSYLIIFTSGETATTTLLPETLLGIDDFVPEVNTIYEISVLDNRAVVGSWVVSV